MKKKRLVVALTGSSGAVYGRRLLQVLAGEAWDIHLTISEAAQKVIRHELDLDLDLSDGADIQRRLLGRVSPRIRYHRVHDLTAPIASGSFHTCGMVIMPCSVGTIGRIASGVSMNLVDRAADVCLKERRTLIVVPRETPLSEIHLDNMLRLTRAGAVVLPASPGFYADTRDVGRLVDFVVARVLDQLEIEHDLMRGYGEPALRALTLEE